MVEQKYHIGQEVKVEFRGTVYRVEQDATGMLTYDVRGEGMMRAHYMPTSYLTQEEGEGK